MSGDDPRQPKAPYPSPQDALDDGGDAEELKTDAADTPEPEIPRPGEVPGHTVSTRLRRHDPSAGPARRDGVEEDSPEFPETAAARDLDLDEDDEDEDEEA